MLRETAPLTGEQYSLERQTAKGVLKATITQVGASLRTFQLGDVDFVEDYDPNRQAPLCAGQIMSPWVNRLDGGTWNFNGKTLNNPINIEAQQNSNHGLLLEHQYEVTYQDESSVILQANLDSPAGYPFDVQTFVEYRLGETGISVTHRAINRSSFAIPYATGAHPYFKISSSKTGELTLISSAKTHTLVNERQIPIGEAPTEGTVFDISGGIKVKDHFFDDDFSGLQLDEAGNSHCYLKSPQGETLDIWQDSNFKHVVIFTPDFFPSITGDRVHAVAIEPSTSPPNALNSQIDLIWLEPEVEFSATWGVTVI